MKKISEYSLRTITLIQILIATMISLLFQFVFPLNWQPFDRALHGPNVQHGDPGTSVAISTLSQWFFSIAIAWFIYRDNPYINNFLIYSLVPLISVLVMDIVILLYYDYIHFIPLAVDIYILLKKRYTLFQKWFPYYLIFYSVWYCVVYFLRLTYLDLPLDLFILNWIAMGLIGFGITCLCQDSIIKSYVKKNREKFTEENQ
ncbi:MAG: hypothetical protein EU532_01745 [Promethearchaeota archaeon]|nr:MAG: hypothetical protein EU532_01745 [Candidatus Lokiarchaeota archaeon]